jgi:hypothetical protein
LVRRSLSGSGWASGGEADRSEKKSERKNGTGHASTSTAERDIYRLSTGGPRVRFADTRFRREKPVDNETGRF